MTRVNRRRRTCGDIKIQSLNRMTPRSFWMKLNLIPCRFARAAILTRCSNSLATPIWCCWAKRRVALPSTMPGGSGEDDVVLVGFSSHRGTVVAAENWDGAMEVLDVPPGRAESWEDLLHRAGSRDKLLVLRNTPKSSAMQEVRGHRAIGVVYRPQFERQGNYVPSVLPRRYDALLFIDESHALHPLHIEAAETNDAPETYPTGV